MIMFCSCKSCLPILVVVMLIGESSASLMITRHPANTDTCIGNIATMPCGFTGSTAATTIPNWIRTIRNGDVEETIEYNGMDILENMIPNHSYILDEGDDGQLDSSTAVLKIGPIDESYNQSIYQCVFPSLLTNGSVESDPGTITVIEVPTVENVLARDGCSFVFVSWDKISGACMTARYTIQIHEGIILLDERQTTDNFYNFTTNNIQIHVNISVTIHAENGLTGGFNGRSTRVAAMGYRNKLSLISDLDITAECVTYTSFRWMRHVVTCGRLQFHITITPPPRTRTGASYEITTESNETYHTFGNLVNNERYLIEIFPTTRAGRGNTLTETIFTPLTKDPPAVTFVPSVLITREIPEDFEISWQRPRVIDECTTLPVTGYLVSVTFNDRTVTSRVIEARGELMRMSFSQLFPGRLRAHTRYTFAVRAFNQEADFGNPGTNPPITNQSPTVRTGRGGCKPIGGSRLILYLGLISYLAVIKLAE